MILFCLDPFDPFSKRISNMKQRQKQGGKGTVVLLGQQFCPRGDYGPQRASGMSGDIFSCHNLAGHGGGYSYWHQVVRGQGRCWRFYTCQNTCTTQNILVSNVNCAKIEKSSSRGQILLKSKKEESSWEKKDVLEFNLQWIQPLTKHTVKLSEPRFKPECFKRPSYTSSVHRIKGKWWST